MPQTLLTDTAEAKLSIAAGSGTQVNITHIALGDAGGANYDPTYDQAALINERVRRPIDSSSQPDPQTWLVKAEFPADTAAFEVREIGFFDADGDLIAVWAGIDVTPRQTGAIIYMVEHALNFSRVANGLIIVTAPTDNLAIIEDAISDLQSVLGVNDNETDLGNFAGGIIPDGATVKSALATLEAGIQNQPTGLETEIARIDIANDFGLPPTVITMTNALAGNFDYFELRLSGIVSHPGTMEDLWDPVMQMYIPYWHQPFLKLRAKRGTASGVEGFGAMNSRNYGGNEIVRNHAGYAAISHPDTSPLGGSNNVFSTTVRLQTRADMRHLYGQHQGYGHSSNAGNGSGLQWITGAISFPNGTADSPYNGLEIVAMNSDGLLQGTIQLIGVNNG